MRRFRQLVGELAERGNASVALLRMDGIAIAAQVLMYCGATAYTWNTAFDPKYAKYSPGALLIDKATKRLFSTPGRRMMDLLVDVNSGKSLGFALEMARWRGYQRLRKVRNRLRAHEMASAKKMSPLV